MPETAPLYSRLIGGSWAALADPLRRIHAGQATVRASGQMRIEHGSNPVARIITWVFRLPKPNRATDVRLEVAVRGDEQVWRRTFGGRCLNTRQYASTGLHLAERFGVLEFRYRLDPRGGSLFYIQRDAAFRLGSVRLLIPAKWAPRVEAREDSAGPKQIAVDVRIVLPGVGPLISYNGTIVIEGGPA